MRLSIVIPALNEESTLGQTLFTLPPVSDQLEIIVVDGGSIDSTLEIAREAGVIAIHAPPGRARQMNAGAAAASGDRLLFLHSDTALPQGGAHSVVRSKGRWGRFDVSIDGNHWMFPVIGFFINRRSRWSGIATGDQAMFIDRDLFESVGGFPDQPLMEDVELCRRLKRISPPDCLAPRVRTSGRRWLERGVWKTIFLMWRLRWAYWRGARPEDLARAYR